ncbi:hypothetical protein CWE13_05085 [Aliidiomarina shirensis]|uniref:Outer membrane protein beta-barrel domain-containing protein n=1 Tax=Aliidiomarina shirensis TaxID=1048642 RepID=A0A432WUB0_9GAMM|nr:porin family protein [Aliidiomarina shirensis]RUO37338.1 hypothetical protein CWE13_05085 [Aliidiomarina shirensis]
MKKLLPISLAILLSTSITAAQANDTWYVGASYNAQEISQFNRDFNTAGVIAGYRFTEHLALEARYAGGTSGYSDFTVLPNDASVEYKEDISSQASLMFKASYPVFEAFSVYALAGYSTTDLEYNSYTGSYDSDDNLIGYAPVKGSVSYDGFAYGIGINYKLSKNFNLFIDYQVLPDFAPDDNVSASWNSATFGINYSF